MATELKWLHPRVDVASVLHRVVDAEVFYKRDPLGLLSGKYRILLQLGRKTVLSEERVTPTQFRAMAVESEQEPVRYLVASGRSYWRFAGVWYSEVEGLSTQAVRALVNAMNMRRARRISTALEIEALGHLPLPSQRTPIPKDVKLLVYTRDGGKCRSCGSEQSLEFDHVFPVSKGGSDSAENLQLLCTPCNRRKGASIG